MKEKYKNILKILGIWLGVILIITFLFGCFLSRFDAEITGEFFWVLIISSFGFFIVFSPAILVLYLLFKKIRNKNLRILLTAFVIPFTNFIYLFIEYFCFNDNYKSYIIGLFTLCFTLPLFFIIGLCTPKSILPIKWNIVKTVVLTAIFGIFLIYLSLFIISNLEDIKVKNKLEYYDVLINEIENYKQQKGVYPQKIEDKVQKFKEFNYDTKNSGKDYILTVGDSYFKKYNYCSTDKLEDCYPKETGNSSCEKFGKWIKVVIFD